MRECRPIHGSLRILDFELLMRSLLPYIEETVGSHIVADLRFTEMDNDRFNVTYDCESIEIEDPGSLADCLFLNGPESMEKSLSGKDTLRDILEMFLPLTCPKYDMSYT